MPAAEVESTGSRTITSTPWVTIASTCDCCLVASWSAFWYRISQSGQSSWTVCLEQRLVLGLVSRRLRSPAAGTRSCRSPLEPELVLAARAVVAAAAGRRGRSRRQDRRPARAAAAAFVGDSSVSLLSLCASRAFWCACVEHCPLVHASLRVELRDVVETIRLVHHQRQRAEHLGALAEHARRRSRAPRRARDGDRGGRPRASGRAARRPPRSGRRR